jgi:outer membrane lipoprotein
MKMTVKNAVFNMMVAVGASAIAACTSIPTQLQGEYAEITPARAQADMFGSNVRWGGVLIDTHNEENRTCFEVLSRVLDRSMRPQVEDQTAGRFIACTNGFHDPEIYAKGREVTITGQFQNMEVRVIDEFDYNYPIIEITDLVLWEERKNVRGYEPYYDPFYYPYYWGYPYGGYFPYYRYPGGFYGSGYMHSRRVKPGVSTVIKRDH